jgi:hypothetical protein
MIPSSRFHIFAAAILLIVGVSAVSRAQDTNPPNQDEHTKAVGVVRIINTAESWYNIGATKGATDAHGRYATWDELCESAVLKTVEDRFHMTLAPVSCGPEVIPGHRLDLIVSPDGKSYSLALHSTSDSDGLWSVFSDQNGIIFTGSPIT